MVRWRKALPVAVVAVVVAVVGLGRYGTLAPCGMLQSAIDWAQPEPGPWTMKFFTPTQNADARSTGWCLKMLWKVETEGLPPELRWREMSPQSKREKS